MFCTQFQFDFNLLIMIIMENGLKRGGYYSTEAYKHTTKIFSGDHYLMP